MNIFVNAVDNQLTTTENGMPAFVSTTNAATDFFFKAGASRGKDIIPDFVASFVEDQDLAVRITLWLRDIRQGSGERKLFRDILQYLEVNAPEICMKILPKISELGRWDDYFSFKTIEMKPLGFSYVAKAITEGNKLAAKWAPREKSTKKEIAKEFRIFLGLTPSNYRKFLAGNTEVVESLMCSNRWDEINFSHVPSLAHARYKKCFNRHTPKYQEYVNSLVKKDNPEVKVNAGAVYPYDVIKGVSGYRWTNFSKTEQDLIIEQWAALPNYVGDASILPLVDVSGSMTCTVGRNVNLSCMDVAVSLGLYLAEKNTGKFKDTFLTFSGNPQLFHLKGNVIQKTQQMITSDWAMNTNIHKAIEKILKIAIDGKVSQKEMPNMLLILSDMQFDECVNLNLTAMELIKYEYEKNGYSVPNIVFWNLRACDNVPVRVNEKGVALVSGFSPAILKSLLSVDGLKNFTPVNIMLNIIMKDRYSWN